MPNHHSGSKRYEYPPTPAKIERPNQRRNHFEKGKKPMIENKKLIQKNKKKKKTQACMNCYQL